MMQRSNSLETSVVIADGEGILIESAILINDHGKPELSFTHLQFNETSVSMKQTFYLDMRLEINDLLEMRKALGRHIKHRTKLEAYINEVTQKNDQSTD